MKLTIKAKDFRVRDGHEVDLKKWPTKVEPAYKSKEQYKKLLEDHVAQLSSQQQLFDASKMTAAGRDAGMFHRGCRCPSA